MSTDLPGSSASYGDWLRACQGSDQNSFRKSTFDDCRKYLLKARLVSLTDDIYVSLVRTENRTSTGVPHRTGTDGTGGIYTPVPNRTSVVELSSAGGGGVQTPPPEAAQTAPYHRHNLKTIRTLSSGISICDDCHPKPARGAPPPHSA